MDANILKTAISSIIYVAEEDIQKINDFNPTDEKAYSPEYLFSIANIAQNVSKSFKGIEKLIESHVADIANIDGETLNSLTAADEIDEIDVAVMEAKSDAVAVEFSDKKEFVDPLDKRALLKARQKDGDT